MSALDDLLSDLGAAPRMPDAQCRGQHELFDPVVGEHASSAKARHDKALELCRRCPALQACGQWYSSLRATDRPGGVVAGKIRVHKAQQRTAS